jgi:hypothetical protein
VRSDPGLRAVRGMWSRGGAFRSTTSLSGSGLVARGLASLANKGVGPRIHLTP